MERLFAAINPLEAQAMLKSNLYTFHQSMGETEQKVRARRDVEKSLGPQKRVEERRRRVDPLYCVHPFGEFQRPVGKSVLLVARSLRETSFSLREKVGE